MLKGLAAWVLNTYLGKYLENLNTDQLSIALLQGEVELENLPLKKDAFNSFEFPLEIHAGFVQKIKVTIPFTRLRSEPLVISIEGLYIIVGPVSSQTEFNEEQEEQAKQFRKLAKLDAIEARWRATHDMQQESYYATSYSSWFSYGASLVSGIVENVQLNIYDVHIRYEDAQTNPSSPFAWGITIASLTAQGTDENWVTQFVDRSDADATRKLMKLQDLTLYWDTNATMFGHLPFQQLCDTLKVFRADSSSNTSIFIIEPVSTCAKLQRNCSVSPLRSRSTPRFICNLDMDSFSVSVSEDQYRSMALWTRELDRLGKSRGFVKGRPAVGIQEDVKAWWVYAINSQRAAVRTRWQGRTWERVLSRAKDIVQYVKAYTEHLKNPVTCPLALRELKDRVEMELTYEELMILRDVVMDRLQSDKSALNNGEKKKARGILQSWFPLYRGWYSTPATSQQTFEDSTSKVEQVEKLIESKQEEEILDVLNDTVENDTLLRRDTVFAQVNFALKKGTFSLRNGAESTPGSGATGQLFELGFAEMRIGTEFRPRTGSVKLQVGLGDMHLCDKFTEGSAFPQLIASHRAQMEPGYYQQKQLKSTSPRHQDDAQLFEFTYESKPFDSTAAFRVRVKSRSLDIVCNPAALKRFREFVSSPFRGFRFGDAAKNRYEELKKQTQDELKRNLEKILDSEQPFVQQWDIQLQISAPQIIIPENMFNCNTTVVVCDFGQLQFSTASSQVQAKPCDDIQESDSEDDFKTPCSSPPDGKPGQFQPSLPSVQENVAANITEAALHERMYDSYMLDLSDLQIMVCRATDNWRRAYIRGTSSLHVLDKFTISLRLERRIVYTTDPHWPNVKLLGNLPKLVVHMNEQKIQAVRSCLANLEPSVAKPQWSRDVGENSLLSRDAENSFVEDEHIFLDKSMDENERVTQDDSHLFVMQFHIEQMSLEIQSRGRSVAEVQVKGIRSTFAKNPRDVSVTLTVHSLLLVDALQTFGPDFELLIASHKNVCIDTMSGSLRDSEPTSPASPTSSYTSVTSPTALNSALNNLQLRRLSSNMHDSEALISMEVSILDDGHVDVSVRFNNLDIIANQETIVELLGFLQRTELTNLRRTSNLVPPAQEITTNSSDKDIIGDLATQSLHITFEFHTLSILLMKSVSKDNILVAHKVATATMTGAKINAILGSEMEIRGSLGGLQVLDLSDLGNIYKRILCVGREPLVDRPLNLTERLHAEVYRGAPDRNLEGFEESKAFSFTVKCSASVFEGKEETDMGDSLSVTLRVASVWYTYSRHFLAELASCATEFRQYALKLANSIRSAAAEMAYEIVTRRTDFGSDAKHLQSESVVGLKTQTKSLLAGFEIRLDIVLESPVLVIPESETSGNILVSRLGRITVRNWRPNISREEFADTLKLENGTNVEVDSEKSERIHVDIKDMNLHSLHLHGALQPSFTYRPQELDTLSDKRLPILHDTVVNISVDWLVGEAAHEEDPDRRNVWNVAVIEGKVVNELKVSLIKRQYRQILNTLDHLMTNSKQADTSESWQSSAEEMEVSDEQQLGNEGPTAPTWVVETQQRFAARAALSLPEFMVELQSGIDDMTNDTVALCFRDFKFNLEKDESDRTIVEVTLKSVTMEDLREEVGSKNRFLMTSSHHGPKVLGRGKKFLSTSCPDILRHRPILSSQQSLPDKLHTESAFRDFQKREQRFLYGYNYRGRNQESQKRECPYTPPPSPDDPPENEEKVTDTLVHVKVLMVDKTCPQFTSKYNSTNRFVNVNFNALEMSINPQSWVMVLDFFDIGNANNVSSSAHEIQLDTYHGDIPEEINSEMVVQVRSLTLTLIKESHEMAKANVSNFNATLTNRDGNFNVDGKLGCMSLKDLTCNGQLYPERFLSIGKEALDFKFFKYGQTVNRAERDHDASLKVKMSSVVYVHTNRFYMEMMAFFQHFNRLQDLLAKFRREPADTLGCVTRVLLNIQAGSPVILVPRSAFANEIIVANLGNLTVRNRFLNSGWEGTFGAKMDTGEKTSSADQCNSAYVSCLLDVMSVDLQDMDLYSAERLERDKLPVNVQVCDVSFGNFVIKRKGEPLLKQKCELKLQIERNLHSDFSHSVPEIRVEGEISTVHCSVDAEQYKIIRGILKQNLGEQVEVDIPTDLFVLLPPGRPKENGETWTTISFHVNLVDVTLELLVSHRVLPTCREQSLAKINLFRSKLIFQSSSDQSTIVDLVSQEILVSDTRFKDEPANQRPNVFFNILQPMASSQQGLLQAEIHYRSTPEFTRFTVLLNNMRVMAVFDWWTAFLGFISADVDDDHSTPTNEIEEVATMASRSFSSKYAVSLSSGVITKRAPLLEENKLSYEMKINITETEVVVVEDTATWDSSAVILKSTTVIWYRPVLVEKPLSCSLQNLEVFSCTLGLEDDTALSIIDPLTINIDINGRPKPGRSGGLLDATSTGEVTHALEISLHDLNIRLSYHDIQMFASILESLPRQANMANYYQSNQGVLAANFNPRALDTELVNKIGQLQSIGFEADDCRKAITACEGNLDEAAIWLTQNAAVTVTESAPRPQLKSIDIKDLEVRVACVCLCLIDDCKDADVPLAELTLSGFYLHQTMGPRVQGTSNCLLAGDFYNRALSGWEPFLEPWRCRVKWDKGPLSSGQGSKLTVTFTGEDVLNFNVNSNLLQLYRSVKANWTEDYYGLSSRVELTDTKSKYALAPRVGHRRRAPFVPFALKNSTGCNLWFVTVMASPDKLLSIDYGGGSWAYQGQGNPNWIQVPPDGVVPFTFENRGKLRHRDTHDVKVHQLLVRVEGWQQMAPVSVDKVGVFFRQARPQISRAASVYTEIPPARVVFEVTLEGQAQKLVTVRSALQIGNRLGETVTLRMENSVFQLGVSAMMKVEPNHTVPVPLPYTSALLSVCPTHREVDHLFCNPPISWQHVTKQAETHERILTCLPKSLSGRLLGHESYKFCARVTRENYPMDSMPSGGSSASQPRSRGYGFGVNPGHLITLLPPVTLVNLLPYELVYRIPAVNPIQGCVKTGKMSAIFSVDVTAALEVVLSIEGFQLCGDLVVPAESGNFTAVLRFRDNRERLLLICAKVTTRYGCAYQISLSAAYWLVNRSGLPLVFRQEGSAQEAAGQFPEHEMARSVSPLLFSFTDRDSPSLCCMRVGRSVHLDGEPQWCHHFHLEKGIQFRRLRVSAPNFRPEWVYVIGIDVRVGKGQYQDTHIVTLSPRFYIENNTRHQIELTQRFLLEKGNVARSRLSAMSKSSLPFHWTRIDMEQLLCMRIVDVPGCHWSGGFGIEKIDSFHINMRDLQGKSLFLRVEVVLQEATYRVIFLDADKMPPPFRVDNLSEVPITFQQADVSEDRLRTVVRPGASVPYAWDEPMLRHLIVCCPPGGVGATYNMDQFGEGKKLTYENFIYIAFATTFHSHSSSSSCKPGDYRCNELVLDVPTGTRVVLSRKEPGKRTQLWRMTMAGLLQHEGSSPPRDPKRPSNTESDRVLVLDIAEIGSLPFTYVGLILRKPDQRRASTQTWKFTEDGRLCCQHSNLFVQPKDGLNGLRPGNDVVLGQSQMVCLVTTDSGVPVEQVVSRQRLRPGSGVLDVKVIPDGPTRVLQVSDIRGKPGGLDITIQSDWAIIEDFGIDTVPKRRTFGHSLDLQLLIQLREGMGLSLVNRTPEELVYVFLKNISLELVKTATEEKVCGSVENFSVSNQLFDAELPVLVFVTPSTKNDNRHHLPAINFTAHRIPSSHLNVDIFKLLMVTVKNLTVQIEERLLWKLVQFFSDRQSESEIEERDHEMHRQMQSVASVQAKRYYFNNLKLILQQMRLSVITSSRLPPDLKIIKKKMGLTLVRFADAQVELDAFVRVHPFETAQFIVDAILEHYKEELTRQAAKILGSVDFLGNPVGLMNDVTEGLSGLVTEGNVGGLLKNVTHGLSNSAAKVTRTLSDGLGVVTMDERHQEKRKKIRSDHKGGSSDHIVAGLKGLGVGLLGGVTSIFSQTYEGASNEGLQGFISGFGKGLVGTVTKPAAGVLDFATGAASAVRDTSRSSIHEVPDRPRATRLCVGLDGLLLKYSAQQARGQEILFELNGRDYTERFFGYEQLGLGSDRLYAVITDKRVFFLTHGPPTEDNVRKCAQFEELQHCGTVAEIGSYETMHYIELVIREQTSEMSLLTSSIKKPKVRCDTESFAVKVAQQINYAKSLYEERVHTLLPLSDDED